MRTKRLFLSIILVLLLVTFAPATVFADENIAPLLQSYDCTITADNAVFINSTGNIASVADAGAGVTYDWTVTGSGTITSTAPYSNSITWDAGAAGIATIDVEVDDGINPPCTDTVDVNVAPLVEMELRVTNLTGDIFDATSPANASIYTGPDRTGGDEIISGTNFQVRYEMSCLSTVEACENPKLDLTYDPPEGNGEYWSTHPTLIVCSPSTSIVSKDSSGIVFVSPMAAGSTVECVYTYRTYQDARRIPDGTVLAVDASLTADNASTVTGDAQTVVANQATLWVQKITNTGTQDPVVDFPFSYLIGIGNTLNPLTDENGVHNGWWWVYHYSITDTLLSGVDLLEVTVPNDPDAIWTPGGGSINTAHTIINVTGDQATGYTIEIIYDYEGVWPKNTGVGSDGYTSRHEHAKITVVYPSAEGFTTASEVTNTASVEGYPANVPAEPQYLLTDDDPVTHSFQDVSVSGFFSKLHSEHATVNADDVQLGEQFFWRISFYNQNTNIPTRVEIIDSPMPDGSSEYYEFFRTDYFVWRSIPRENIEAYFYYTTNLNSTEQVVGPVSPDTHSGSSGITGAGTPNVRLDVGPGEIINVDNITEWVTGFRIVYPEFPFGVYTNVYTVGHYDESMRETIIADAPIDLRVESENCASATQTSLDGTVEYTPRGPACDDIWVKVVQPFVSARKASDPYQALTLPGGTVLFRLRLASATEDEGLGLNPVVVDLLPPEATYVPGSVAYQQPWLTTTGMPEPEFEVVNDYKGSGRQALIWTWPNGETIPPGAITRMNFPESIFVNFEVEVAYGTPIGTYTNEMWVYDGIYGDPDLAYCGFEVNEDPFDVDNDGDFAEDNCHQTGTFMVVEAAAMLATKWVKGDADPDWLRTPDIGSTSPAPTGSFDYKIEFTNIGNIPLTDLIMYDILPFVGDTGVSESLNGPRQSEWTPVLAGPVSIDVSPYTVDIYYSHSSDPCRPEVYPSGPVGCVDDWSTTPGDLTTVKALKFDLGDSIVEPNLGFELLIPFNVPLTNPSNDFVEINQVAWNSIAYTGNRAGGCEENCDLLIVEPLKVGVQIPPASVGGLISWDIDGDGVQDPDAGEGLSGVDITLACTDSYGREVEYTTTTSDGTIDVDGDGIIDPAGSYFFGGMLPGGCTLSVDESTLPTDLQGNNTLDPDGLLDSTSQIGLEAGQRTTPDQNFAYSMAAIDVEKATNGVDADVAPGPSVDVGVAVTWTYVITNLGTSHLANVTLSDDQVTIDFTTCVYADTSLADKDTDGDIDVLLIGETVTCEATGAALSGQYENTASVTGTPAYIEFTPDTVDPDTGDVTPGVPVLDGNGIPVITGPVPNVDPPADEDLSHYMGVPAAIGDTVWLDINGDGVEDGGDEIGLAGATVTLTGTDDFGNVVSLTTTTDANGNYIFEGLAAGTYTVTVDVSTVTNLPAGVTHERLAQSFDADGTGTPNASEVTVAAGDINLDQDFGYSILPNTSLPDLPLPETGFAPGRITRLPNQPAEKQYFDYVRMVLDISSLGIKLDIVGVPTVNGIWDVTWLNRQAGWLTGSAYPTWAGNTVITAHVWDAYNNPGPFAKLSDLQYGDRFQINVGGKTYTYEVRANRLISPENTNAAFVHEEYDWVTLITCEGYNPRWGTYDYRRMVRAVLVDVN